MGFASPQAWADSVNEGRASIATWRKSPTQATTIGVWNDLSMSPGNPVPNYYASSPLVAATLNGGEGLNHGGAVSPATKHVRRLMALTTTATALPMRMMLLDYLLYYPFVDMSVTDEQSMTNSTTLPRYTDGDGVQVMVVLTNPPGAPTSLTFTIGYTNQDGTAGQVSPLNAFGAGVVTGTIGTTDRTKVAGSSGGPFLTLAEGDSGVRSIESFTMVSGTDVGLVSLVLVKPLAYLTLRGIDAPAEIDYLVDQPTMPRIVDGAYLNWVVCPSGSLAATALHGTIETVWGSS